MQNAILKDVEEFGQSFKCAYETIVLAQQEDQTQSKDKSCI